MKVLLVIILLVIYPAIPKSKCYTIKSLRNKCYKNYDVRYDNFYYNCRYRPLLIWDSFTSRYYTLSDFSFSRINYYSYVYNNYKESNFYYRSHYDPHTIYGKVKIIFPSEFYYYDHSTKEFKKSGY